jgi:hypothetical protein
MCTTNREGLPAITMQAPVTDTVSSVFDSQVVEPIGTYEEDKLLSRAVMCAEILPGTMEECEAALERYYTRFGTVFKSRKDCDGFAMLPLPTHQKMTLLQMVITADEKAAHGNE